VIHIIIQLSTTKPGIAMPNGNTPPPSVRVSTCWRSLLVLGLAPHPLEPGGWPLTRCRNANGNGTFVGLLKCWVFNRYLEEGRLHNISHPNGKEVRNIIDSNCAGWDPGYVIVPRRVKRCVKRVSKYIKPIWNMVLAYVMNHIRLTQSHEFKFI